MALRLAQLLPPVGLLVLAVSGILLLVVPVRDVKNAPGNTFGIVLDAGSSHTSMYIYKWPSDKQNGTGIVTQHSECHVKGGGISSYAGVRGGAAKSLEACLQQAMQDVPPARHRQTPISLGATAGMRLLEMVDATEARRVLREVETKLRASAFSFKEAVILSGQAEGAYGWVTVNYLLENFAKYGFVGQWLNPGRETIGALDLGGASTQITFQTSEAVESEANLMELKLYGQTYRLYTQSFLCYGQDQLLRKLLAHLIKSQQVKPLIYHPCYPRGFNTTVRLGADVYDSPCTTRDRPARFDPLANVTVVGQGDAARCLGALKELFSFHNCSYTKCSFDGIFQPDVTGNFMAFSAFYFTHNYLTRLSNIPITSFSQMTKAVQLVCNMSMSEMVEKTQQSERYTKNVCAVSNFVQLLLTDGYKFDERTFASVSFQRTVGGSSVGWALGYMLSLSNQVPAESLGLMRAMPSGHWAGILFLFVLLLLFALAYMLMVFRNARTKQDLV